MNLDSLPIWGLFAGVFLVVMLSIEAGYGLGQVANWRVVDEKESPRLCRKPEFFRAA
jgi:hypothetical protein